MMRCKQCEVERPESDFYARRKICKPCVLAHIREYRQNNITKIRERDRKRGSLPSRVEARKLYQKTSEGKAAHLKACRVYTEANKARRKAQIALANWRRRNPDKVPECCSHCGKVGSVEGHHPDYSAPLSVVWLCPPCHQTIHLEYS